MIDELKLNGKICKSIDTHDGLNNLFECDDCSIVEVYPDSPLPIEHGKWQQATDKNLPYGLFTPKNETKTTYFRDDAATYLGSLSNKISDDVVAVNYTQSKYNGEYLLSKYRGNKDGWIQATTVKSNIPTEQQAKKELIHYMTYH